MDQAPKLPDALMREIAADLKPVKPSPLPFQLTLRMVPLALVVSSIVLVAIGVRKDSGELGPLVTWVASAMQFGLSILLIWIAAHEGIPAGRLPRRIVYFAPVVAILFVVAVTLPTIYMGDGSEDSMMGPSAWVMDLACGIGSTVAGAILVLLFSWLFRKAIAIRPTLSGFLYGAGAGIAINAGWRIACPVATFRHTLGSHGTAIVATALIGGLIGHFLGKRRLRRA